MAIVRLADVAALAGRREHRRGRAKRYRLSLSWYASRLLKRRRFPLPTPPSRSKMNRLANLALSVGETLVHEAGRLLFGIALGRAKELLGTPQPLGTRQLALNRACDPLEHRSKEAPRQMALRQEQPIVPGEPANAALPPFRSWRNHEQSCANWNVRSAFGWREYKRSRSAKEGSGSEWH